MLVIFVSTGWPSTQSASCSSIIFPWTSTPVLSSSPAVNIHTHHTHAHTHTHISETLSRLAVGVSTQGPSVIDTFGVSANRRLDDFFNHPASGRSRPEPLTFRGFSRKVRAAAGIVAGLIRELNWSRSLTFNFYLFLGWTLSPHLHFPSTQAAAQPVDKAAPSLFVVLKK